MNLPDISADSKIIKTKDKSLAGFIYEHKNSISKDRKGNYINKNGKQNNSTAYYEKRNNFPSNQSFKYNKHLYNSASPNKKYGLNIMRETAGAQMSLSMISNQNVPAGMSASSVSLNKAKGGDGNNKNSNFKIINNEWIESKYNMEEAWTRSLALLSFCFHLSRFSLPL